MICVVCSLHAPRPLCEENNNSEGTRYTRRLSASKSIRKRSSDGATDEPGDNLQHYSYYI